MNYIGCVFEDSLVDFPDYLDDVSHMFMTEDVFYNSLAYIWDLFDL